MEMNVKIYLDIACPYSYIGKKKFETAMKEFDEINFDVEYKSYELDLKASKHPEKNLVESLADKTGVSVQDINRQHRILIESAKNEGIDLHLEKVVPANTRDAHRLLKLGIESGKGSETLDELYYRNFTLNENIASKETLLSVADTVQLDNNRAKEITNDPSLYTEYVIEDYNYGKLLGITSVPRFIFNDRFKMDGARDVDHYIYAIEKTIEEMKNTGL